MRAPHLYPLLRGFVLGQPPSVGTELETPSAEDLVAPIQQRPILRIGVDRDVVVVGRVVHEPDARQGTRPNRHFRVIELGDALAGRSIPEPEDARDEPRANHVVHEAGGWPARETAHRFAEYAGHVADARIAGPAAPRPSPRTTASPPR